MHQHYLFSTTPLFAEEIAPVKSGRWMLSQHCKGLHASWTLVGILPEWGETVRLWGVRLDPLKAGELFSHDHSLWTSVVLVQAWGLTCPIVPQKGVTTHRENRTAEFLIFFSSETKRSIKINWSVWASCVLPRAVGQQAGTEIRGHCGDGNRFRVGCWGDVPPFWNSPPSAWLSPPRQQFPCINHIPNAVRMEVRAHRRLYECLAHRHRGTGRDLPGVCLWIQQRDISSLICFIWPCMLRCVTLSSLGQTPCDHVWGLPRMTLRHTGV